MMSEPSVTERRIRPIQDAIATENWKQALQLCDKWSKKGEKSDKFLVLKAFVLVRQGDKIQHEKGRAEVLDLCNRKPPVTEPEAIYQLQKALKTLSLQEEEGPKVWERAAGAAQDNKDILMRWLNQAIADGKWLSAQKATMGLRKSFPKERNYEFWNIMMCHLIQQDTDAVDEKTRTLFATLAYRMISKAAEQIRTEQDQLLSPGKAVSTPEEVALLAYVLNSTGRASETVKLLRGDTLNLNSKIGKLDPQLTLSLLLQSLEAAESWDEAAEYTQTLLSSPVYQSDDRVWALWLKSQSHSVTESRQTSITELLDSACTSRPISRASYIAKLKYLRSRNDDKSLVQLLQTCEEYANAFSTKAFCFDDIKDALEQLDEEHFRTFTQSRSEDKSILGQLFSLKLEYSKILSSGSEDVLIDLASRALTLYQSSLSQSPACPEAVFLAVLALLRLSAKEGGYRYAIRAIIILEAARKAFEDYYLFTVLLVQLGSHLGLISSAMETFTKLSVKNLQYETVAHLILTRISSLHPSPSIGADGSFDPLDVLDTGLTILENADMALVRGIREALRYNNYSNISNSVRMRRDMKNSASRQLYTIEERKVRRVLGLSEDAILEQNAEIVIDLRDWAYLPNYRKDDRQVLEGIQCGPIQRKGWIDAMRLLDNVTTYFNADLAGHATILPKLVDHITTGLSTIDKLSKQQLAELTSAETKNLEAHKLMAKVAILLHDASPPTREKIEEITSPLKAWLQDILTAEKTPTAPAHAAGFQIFTWEQLHTSISRLETLQVVAMLLGVLSRRAKGKSKAAAAIPKDEISTLQTLVTDVEKQIHENARSVREGINASGVLGKLVDLGYARKSEDDGDAERVDLTQLEQVLEKIVDEVTMETICGKIKGSWEDSLDGVLAVKVRIWK